MCSRPVLAAVWAMESGEYRGAVNPQMTRAMMGGAVVVGMAGPLQALNLALQMQLEIDSDPLVEDVQIYR